jgi:hypothetical protein
MEYNSFPSKTIYDCLHNPSVIHGRQARKEFKRFLAIACASLSMESVALVEKFCL